MEENPRHAKSGFLGINLQNSVNQIYNEELQMSTKADNNHEVSLNIPEVAEIDSDMTRNNVTKLEVFENQKYVQDAMRFSRSNLEVTEDDLSTREVNQAMCGKIAAYFEVVSL